MPTCAYLWLNVIHPVIPPLPVPQLFQNTVVGTPVFYGFYANIQFDLPVEDGIEFFLGGFTDRFEHLAAFADDHAFLRFAFDTDGGAGLQDFAVVCERDVFDVDKDRMGQFFAEAGDGRAPDDLGDTKGNVLVGVVLCRVPRLAFRGLVEKHSE